MTLIASSCAIFLQTESSYQQMLVRRIPPPLFEAPADRLNPALEGKVVHLTALVRASSEPRDEEFGVSAAGLMLRREVYECYQRNKKKRDWRPLEGRQSAIASRKFYPPQVFVGPFPLTGEDVYHNVGGRTHPVRSKPAKLPPEARWNGQFIYLQGRLDDPQPGDRKIVYSSMPLTVISVVGKQSQGTLQPPPNHRQLWIRNGTQGADEYLKPLRTPWPAPWEARFKAAFQLLLGLTLLGSPWIVRKLHRPLKEDPILKHHAAKT